MVLCSVHTLRPLHALLIVTGATFSIVGDPAGAAAKDTKPPGRVGALAALPTARAIPLIQFTIQL